MLHLQRTKDAAAPLTQRGQEAEERRLVDRKRGIVPKKRKPSNPKKKPRIADVIGGLPGPGKCS